MPDNSRFSIGFSIPTEKTQEDIYDLLKDFEKARFVNAQGVQEFPNFRSIKVRADDATDIIDGLRKLKVRDIHGLDRHDGRENLSSFLQKRGINHN